MNDFDDDIVPERNQQQQLVRKWAGKFAQSAAQTMQELTARKYTLPDKNVASQLLMYRQLLHTKCRPGLKLSREYQGTPAQQAVKHMPWWAQGCETTGKMVISYDNLIRRLWLHGAIFPYSDDCTSDSSMNTLLNEEGMPPIPHEYWVHRLGFQQQDPVTDFRSGGVLSLALMLHVAESCPKVLHRYVRPKGDASVLPFGITSINITDMLAKFLMLAKSVDRMDALLSQKPFWLMFADPNAITACQELAMDMLADVVLELQQQRGSVTVFDFSVILAKTERRVQYDLLGAGPKTVAELYEVHARVKLKYQQQLENGKEVDNKDAPPFASPQVPSTDLGSSQSMGAAPPPKVEMKDQVLQRASFLASSATNLAGSVFSRIKAPGFNPLNKHEGDLPSTRDTIDEPTSSTAAATTANEAATPATYASNVTPDEEEWVRAESEIQATTDAVSQFSIADEEDGT